MHIHSKYVVHNGLANQDLHLLTYYKLPVQTVLSTIYLLLIVGGGHSTTRSPRIKCDRPPPTIYAW